MSCVSQCVCPHPGCAEGRRGCEQSELKGQASNERGPAGSGPSELLCHRRNLRCQRLWILKKVGWPAMPFRFPLLASSLSVACLPAIVPRKQLSCLLARSLTRLLPVAGCRSRSIDRSIGNRRAERIRTGVLAVHPVCTVRPAWAFGREEQE